MSMMRQSEFTLWRCHHEECLQADERSAFLPAPEGTLNSLTACDAGLKVGSTMFLPQTMLGAPSLARASQAEKKPPGECHCKLTAGGTGRATG
jgi:hypothetical protein